MKLGIKKIYPPKDSAKQGINYLINLWAVVVAQLVEQTLSTPEICSSNPFMGKFYILWTVLKSIDSVKQGSSQQNKTRHHQPPFCFFASARRDWSMARNVWQDFPERPVRDRQAQHWRRWRHGRRTGTRLPSPILTGKSCGQSYKASTMVIYESRVVNLSNWPVSMTLAL